MIATAELPLTGFAMDEILDVEKPVLLAANSPCYRLEAGAYGKFSKGLYRVHQFDKLEMYIYSRPDQSEALLEEILSIEESLCEQLEIPYHVIRIADGDLSAPAYKKYDVEYWSPVDASYRELTSCSNCTDYQARRLNIRFRAEDGTLQHPHTLNGTAVTSSRTLIAILENHQTEDGRVRLPAALVHYYRGEYMIKYTVSAKIKSIELTGYIEEKLPSWIVIFESASSGWCTINCTATSSFSR
jgi:seryl-tRNA synthetase